MIQFRHSYFKKSVKDFSIEVIEGEKLSETLMRLIAKKPHLKPVNGFKVAINGNLIDNEKFNEIFISAKDQVLILPDLQNGDGTAMLFQLAVIAAAVYTGGAAAAAYGQVAGSVASAAVLTIGSKQLQYLLPTPSLNNNSDPQRNSQTYTLDSQSNSIKKFQKVHKVYGHHKIFPNLAATPYTDLELDPETGKLAQFFYAIYHVSQGQVDVSDIRIGSTSIDLFNGCSYRLVDPNRPDVPADGYDAAYNKTFTLYKGSVSAESVGSELNSDESGGGSSTEYQLIRNAPQNSDLKRQQIVVNFICPNGLCSFNSNGDKGNAYIDIDVEFSKTSENVWRAFNDPQYVDNHGAVGSSSLFRGDISNTEIETIDFNNWNPDANETFYTTYKTLSKTGKKTYKTRYGSVVQSIEEFTIGFDLAQSYIPFKNTSGVSTGDKLMFNGQYIGTATNTLGWTTGYTRFKVDYIQRYIPLFKCTRVTDQLTVDEFVQGTKVTTVENTSLINRIVKDTTISRLTIANNDNEAHLASVRFTPKENAEYKVRVTRKLSRQQYTTQILNSLNVTNIVSRYDENPINVTKRNSYIEVRLKATGQLSGAVDNLSCMAQSVLDVYNGSTWVKQATNNPAWVLADLLSGEVNKKPIAKTKLDTASLIDWASYCDAIPTTSGSYQYLEKRYETNFVLDFDITLQSLIAKVTNACQASLRYSDGLYGVLQDRLQTTPVQLFTERNSNGFASSRSYSQPLHALKVTFIDPNKDWQPNVITVYANGYSESTADPTRIEDVDTFACIGAEQAFRFGRYFLFQDTLRKENITINVDFESLVCGRGDLVLLTQEIMRVGGKPARVKSVDTNTGEVVLDDGFTLDSNDSHLYTYRNSQTGELVEDQVVSDILDDDTFILNGVLPSVGDLLVIGIASQVTFRCIVKSIEALDNESARLTLIEQAIGIYDFEDVEAIAEYDPELSNIATASSKPPGPVENLAVDTNSYTVVGSAYQFYIDLDWDSPEGPSFKNFEVYVDFGAGYKLVDTVEVSNFTYIVDSVNLGKVHTFKVLAVSVNGKKMNLIDATPVSATPLDKTSRPSNLTQFNADILNETLQLFWTAVPDIDIKSYDIRFSNDAVNGTWALSELIQEVSGKTTLISTQARTGIYFIKAVDLNNNESEQALMIQTTISSLNNVTVVDTITDAPTYAGIFDKTEIQNGGISLRKSNSSNVLGEEVYYTEGYYYFSDRLDLDQLNQVRLQSNLKVGAFTASDLMSNWTNLEDVLQLLTPLSADWGVELQYRATSSINAISAWVNLASITTLAEGSANVWTDYRKLLITDIQAKYVQFRLKLSSYKSNVTPVVFDFSVTATMTGRSEYKNDLVSVSGSKVVTFDNSFYATPTINITIQSMTAGDKWDITGKTKDGFTVSFTNAGLPVDRTFDYQAVGYGKKASVVI